ncbi:hypothetical protein F2P47_12285 [Parvibaculum sedimenti]|uniref:UrcA family protein n=1 Tax=Parvibaculum sedimenti TaxID=2608632 RepID=A0A6N6VFN4_9HYPH|nr:hypothetical protein [Parvibaculum sedimenti]KAB7739490.1 hypothetical protein F2P47_12285 [Parvibaculum sedimenti]
MMKNISGVAVALGLAAFLLAVPAFAGSASDFPTDDATLSALNDQQLTLVHTAARECMSMPRGPNMGRACVIASVEQAVSLSNNEQLKAFNARMPSSMRYNEYRTMIDVKRVFSHTEK